MHQIILLSTRQHLVFVIERFCLHIILRFKIRSHMEVSHHIHSPVKDLDLMREEEE